MVSGKIEKTSPDVYGRTGIKSLVITELRELAEKYGIEKLILFGSRARGEFRRESDIDLAARGGNIDLFRLAAENDTDTLLCFDVVNLDHGVNAALMKDIMGEGIVLYEKV